MGLIAWGLIVPENNFLEKYEKLFLAIFVIFNFSILEREKRKDEKNSQIFKRIQSQSCSAS